MTSRIYPCDKCGKMRTKAEGGTVFSVCDACWDKAHPAPVEPGSEPPIVWDWAEGRANAYVLGKDEDPANVNLARAYLALKAERDLAAQVKERDAALAEARSYADFLTRERDLALSKLAEATAHCEWETCDLPKGHPGLHAARRQSKEESR